MRRLLTAFLLGALAMIACSCGRFAPDEYEPRYASEPTAGRVEYTFAVHPLHNPALLLEKYQPLIDRLNQQIPSARFRLVASVDYPAFERRLLAGQFDFALPNPYQTVLAEQAGYRIIAKMKGDEEFRGILLVRRDSGITSLRDLKGRAISYPARTALAATMMPQHYLVTHGVPLAETTELYVGSQESAIRSVEVGRSAAGATWLTAWNGYLQANPGAEKSLQVRWRTPPLVNNGVVVKRGTPEAVTRQVAAVLIGLDAGEDGRQVLARMTATGFEPADTHTYDPVRLFLRDYERRVQPLPTTRPSR